MSDSKRTFTGRKRTTFEYWWWWFSVAVATVAMVAMTIAMVAGRH